MAETLTLVSERVDDMPVLWVNSTVWGSSPCWTSMSRPMVTGGPAAGLGSVRWVTHMLAEGDHRRNHVVPWATQRLHTLQADTEHPIHPWTSATPDWHGAGPCVQRRAGVR